MAGRRGAGRQGEGECLGACCCCFTVVLVGLVIAIWVGQQKEKLDNTEEKLHETGEKLYETEEKLRKMGEKLHETEEKCSGCEKLLRAEQAEVARLSDCVCSPTVHDVAFDLKESFLWGCNHGDLDIIECAIKRIEAIEDWLKKNNKCKILVTGKTGTGKTTLIKGLSEKYQKETGDLHPRTKTAHEHTWTYGRITYTFYDTPGLKDSNDYEYLREIVSKNGEPDILIFAVKMNDHFLLQNEDYKAIANITQAFGWKIWRKALILLTFANLVEPYPVEERSCYSFDNMRRKIIYQFRRTLELNNVEKMARKNLRFIPVGLVSNPKVHTSFWIENFWAATNAVLSSARATDKNKN